MKLYDPDNPFAQPEQLVKLTFSVTPETLGMLEVLFEETAFAFSVNSAGNRAEILCDKADAAATLVHCPQRPLSQEDVHNRDWVSESQAHFKPMHVGSFYVHGTHHTDPAPQNTHAILMDAGAAFGTGEHATTSGCLELLSRYEEAPKNILDMGCGTAILSIAAAKKYPEASILAVDNCPTAVQVSAENVARNGVEHVQCAVSDGYKSDVVNNAAPYDLILANILAKPLIAMAADAHTSSKGGTTLILSGMLTRQKLEVLHSYEKQGFILRDETVRDDWSSLLLTL